MLSWDPKCLRASNGVLIEHGKLEPHLQRISVASSRALWQTSHQRRWIRRKGNELEVHTLDLIRQSEVQCQSASLLARKGGRGVPMVAQRIDESNFTISVHRLLMAHVQCWNSASTALLCLTCITSSTSTS